MKVLDSYERLREMYQKIWRVSYEIKKICSSFNGNGGWQGNHSSRMFHSGQKTRTETTAAETSFEQHPVKQLPVRAESKDEQAGASLEGVKITMMNSKPELEDAFYEAAKRNFQDASGEMEVSTTDKPGDAQKYAAGDPAKIPECATSKREGYRGRKLWI